MVCISLLNSDITLKSEVKPVHGPAGRSASNFAVSCLTLCLAFSGNFHKPTPGFITRGQRWQDGWVEISVMKFEPHSWWQSSMVCLSVGTQTSRTLRSDHVRRSNTYFWSSTSFRRVRIKNASWPHAMAFIAALLDLYWLGCSTHWGSCPFLWWRIQISFHHTVPLALKLWLLCSVVQVIYIERPLSGICHLQNFYQLS